MGCFQSKHQVEKPSHGELIDSITKPLHARKTAPLSEHLDDLLVDKDVRHPGSQDTSLDDISISKHSKTSAIALKNAQAIKQTDVLKVGILEGTTFLNDYIVVDTLGRGSFGKVKLCLNVGDTQLYAVKVIETQQLKQNDKSRALTRRSASTLAGSSAHSMHVEEYAKEVRGEVQVMMGLDHPNLVKLHEVIKSRESGKLLMVMEYCEAGPLVKAGQLSPDRRMPEVIAQYYFKHVVDGLLYLHKEGIVHGDIKPENMLLAGDGNVKISDFGESQILGTEPERSKLSRTLGTPAFLAPEICAGEEYDGFAADIWALGVSLYSFVYGDMPFKGDSLIDLYDDIVEKDVPFPEDVPLSIGLQDLMMRLLSKNPEKRITIEQVAEHPWVQDQELDQLQSALEDELSIQNDNQDDIQNNDGRDGEPSLPLPLESTLFSGTISSNDVENADHVAAAVFPEYVGPEKLDRESSLHSRLAATFLNQMNIKKASSESLAGRSGLAANKSEEAIQRQKAHEFLKMGSTSNIVFKSMADQMQEMQANMLEFRHSKGASPEVGKSPLGGSSSRACSLSQGSSTSGNRIFTSSAPQWGDEKETLSEDDASKVVSCPLSIISADVEKGLRAKSFQYKETRQPQSPFEEHPSSSKHESRHSRTMSNISRSGTGNPVTQAQIPCAALLHFTDKQVIERFDGHSSYVYFIERGEVDVLWEAALPISLEEVFDKVVGNVISEQLSTMDRVDSVGLSEPLVANLSYHGSKKSKGLYSLIDFKSAKFLKEAERSAASFFGLARPSQQELQNQSTGDLEASAEQILRRAHEMLQNNIEGSVDNLLKSCRHENEFVGALSLLEGAMYEDKWCSVITAKGDVTLIRLDKEGLDRFLVQSPLSQVYLRASLARSFAEISKLDTLEKISMARRNVGQAERGTSVYNLFGASLEEAASKFSDTVHEAATAAKLDLFALVGKLREGLSTYSQF